MQAVLGADWTALRKAALFVAYFFASSTMLLVNKVVMTAVPAPALVTSIQYTATALIVAVLALCGVLDASLSLSFALVKSYVSVPLLFSLAIFSNGKLLQYANIETFLVFRFSTPLIVGIADFFFLGKELPTPRSFFSFIFIIAGAVVYVMTDMGFSLHSYAWAVGYTVVIAVEMIFVKHVFNTQDMTTWTRVYLNNLLSLVFQPLFIWSTSEYDSYAALDWNVQNLALVLASALIGLSLAYSGTALRAEVNATTFTLVGVVCKILTMTANVLMWDKHASPVGLGALTLCLAGSTLYQPSGVRQAGDVSTAVWNATDATCCSLCKTLDLSAQSKPVYQSVPTTELADQHAAPVKEVAQRVSLAV